MSEPYCGIKNVPKGKRRGSMQECARASQIRYYGLNVVKKSTAEAAAIGKAQRRPNGSAKISKYMKELGTLTAKIQRLEENLPYKKYADKKEDMKKDIQKFKDKKLAIREKIKKIKDKQENTKNKKASKKK